jgi:hypothetical protein
MKDEEKTPFDKWYDEKYGALYQNHAFVEGLKEIARDGWDAGLTKALSYILDAQK